MNRLLDALDLLWRVILASPFLVAFLLVFALLSILIEVAQEWKEGR